MTPPGMAPMQSEIKRVRPDPCYKKTGLLPRNLFKTSSQGVKLCASVLFDIVAHAPGPNEGHPRGMIFVQGREKCVYDCQFFRSAERPQVDSQQKGRRQPEVCQPGVYHDIRKESFTVSFIFREQAADIVEILPARCAS